MSSSIDMNQGRRRNSRVTRSRACDQDCRGGIQFDPWVDRIPKSTPRVLGRLKIVVIIVVFAMLVMTVMRICIMMVPMIVGLAL